MALTAQVAALQATVEGGLNHLGRRMDSQDRKLDQIETQVRLTNGRVNTLENKEDTRVAIEKRDQELPPLNWLTVSWLVKFGGWVVSGGMLLWSLRDKL